MIVENSAIVAKGLGVRRGGRWVLRPVSFGLPEGAVGIAGPAGSGTSDLLATLATLRRPHTGRLEVLGHDSGTRGGLRLLRSRIGFLPADSPWAASSTVGDFVAYAAYYQRRPATSVEKVLDGLDLRDVAGWPLSSLPPDLRVRAGLAAACVHEPDIAFLDQPFAGLSDAAAAELGPLIAAAAPTVVVTATDTAPLSPWCDSVLVLHHCRLTPADRAPAPVPTPGTPSKTGKPSPRPGDTTLTKTRDSALAHGPGDRALANGPGDSALSKAGDSALGNRPGDSALTKAGDRALSGRPGDGVLSKAGSSALGNGPGESVLGNGPGEGALSGRPGDGLSGNRPGDGVAGSRPGDGVAGSRADGSALGGGAGDGVLGKEPVRAALSGAVRGQTPLPCG